MSHLFVIHSIENPVRLRYAGHLRFDGWDISAFNLNNVDAGVEFYIKMLGFRPVET